MRPHAFDGRFTEGAGGAGLFVGFGKPEAFEDGVGKAIPASRAGIARVEMRVFMRREIGTVTHKRKGFATEINGERIADVFLLNCVR